MSTSHPAPEDETPPSPPLFDLGERGRPVRRRWADLGQATKVTLLTLLALAVGAGLGALATSVSRPLWLAAGLGLAAIGLAALVRATLASPTEQLIGRVERLAHTQRAGSLKSLPTHRGDEVGRLARAVHNLAARGVRDRHEARRIQRNLAAQIERATRRQTTELQQQAWRDELTGLANRRYLDEHLPAQIADCRAQATPLVCLMMDLDNFKQVNDTQGHATGDAFLKLVGKLSKGSIRRTDVAARLGGDEFALLLPGDSIERAERLADSLRHMLRRHLQATHPQAPRVDLSVGLSLLAETASNEDPAGALLAKADERLYRAKRAGKGRTATPHDPEAAQPPGVLQPLKREMTPRAAA